jgi:hypothetical protein
MNHKTITNTGKEGKMNLKKIIRKTLGTIALSTALISGDTPTNKTKTDLKQAMQLYDKGFLNHIRLEAEVFSSCIEMAGTEYEKMDCNDFYLDFSNENAQQQVEECMDSIDAKIQNYNTQIDSLGNELVKNEKTLQKYGKILDLNPKRKYSPKQDFCEQVLNTYDLLYK